MLTKITTVSTGESAEVLGLRIKNETSHKMTISVPTPTFDDADAVRRIERYAGHDFRAVREVDVEVLTIGEDGWPLAEFSALLAKAIETIPADMRERTSVVITEYGSLEISYKRPETEAEYAARMNGLLEYARQQQEAERAEFERLKAKYA